MPWWTRLPPKLERRLGQIYTLDELAAAYDESAAWCKQVAQQTTDQVWAHDLCSSRTPRSRASRETRRAIGDVRAWRRA